MAKIVTVFGATGMQGGSVAERLHRDPNYQVRAVTRNSSSDKAKSLRAKGIEVVQADLDDRQSLANVIEGAYGCFVMTNTQFQRADCEEYEYTQGINVAHVCVAKKLQHVIFSSQPKAYDAMGLQVQHFDAKSRIEEFMKDQALPLTTIMLPCYYDNFLTWLKPQKVSQHKYKLAIPMGNECIDGLCVKQTGEAVRSLLNNKAQTLNKNYYLTGDKLTVKEMAAVLTKHLQPNQFNDAQVHMGQYRQMVNFPGGDQMANMFEFLKRHHARASLEATRKLIPGLKNFDSWVQENKHSLMSVLEQ